MEQNDGLEKLKKVQFSEEEDYQNIPLSTAAKTVIPRNIRIQYSLEEWYEGEIDEQYRRNGYGIYKYENDDIYEGEFYNGLRHGEGEYTYNDGSVYRGDWLKDKKHGKGNYKFDEYEFDGDWEEDCLLSGFTFKINVFAKINDDEDEMDSIKKSRAPTRKVSFSILEEGVELDEDVFEDEEKQEKAKKIVENNLEFIKSKDYDISIDLIGLQYQGNKHALNNVFKNKQRTIEEEEDEDQDVVREHDKNCIFKNAKGKKGKYRCDCSKLTKSALLDQ
jgi:hypothetical protein